MSDFWSVIGEHVQQQGDVTEKLLKNVTAEYQKARQFLSLSGAATETPQLRGSAELFRIFEEYYQLYFPHGGSAVPKFVLTESTEKSPWQ